MDPAAAAATTSDNRRPHCYGEGGGGDSIRGGNNSNDDDDVIIRHRLIDEYLCELSWCAGISILIIIPWWIIVAVACRLSLIRDQGSPLLSYLLEDTL